MRNDFSTNELSAPVSINPVIGIPLMAACVLQDDLWLGMMQTANVDERQTSSSSFSSLLLHCSAFSDFYCFSSDVC